MIVDYKDLEETLIVAMLMDRGGFGWSNVQDLLNRHDLQIEGWTAMEACNQLVQKRLIEARNGETKNAYSIFGRLTQAGREAAAKSGLHLPIVPLAGQAADSFPPLNAPEVSPRIDSAAWTGTQHILVDRDVIEEVRRSANELKNLVYEIHIPNNAQSADLKALVDILVRVLAMCEPEVPLIMRILASPKFRISAAIISAVAAIRGAGNF